MSTPNMLEIISFLSENGRSRTLGDRTRGRIGSVDFGPDLYSRHLLRFMGQVIIVSDNIIVVSLIGRFYAKTLKSSRDDFNVLDNFNISSIKTAIVIIIVGFSLSLSLSYSLCYHCFCRSRCHYHFQLTLTVIVVVLVISKCYHHHTLHFGNTSIFLRISGCCYGSRD